MSTILIRPLTEIAIKHFFPHRIRKIEYEELDLIQNRMIL